MTIWAMRQFFAVIIAGIGIGGSAERGTPAQPVLDPPLSERTLGALVRACNALGYEPSVHFLIVEPGDRSFDPSWTPHNRRHDRYEIRYLRPLFHCLSAHQRDA